MKKLFKEVKKLIHIFLLFFLVSCGTGGDEVRIVRETFKGEHKLRKFVTQETRDKKISGAFFGFVGGFDGEEKTKNLIKFAWEMNDGTYAISNFPLEKVRIKFDNNIKIPTIKFNLSGDLIFSGPTQYMIDRWVDDVVITIKEKDWSLKIALPFENEKM